MRIVAVGLLAMTVLVAGTAQVFGSDKDYAVGYQQYFHYSDSYPDDVSNNGFVNNVQGIAHDDNYWYITVEGALWKIPVTQTLYGVDVGTPGVSMVTINQITCPYGGVQRTLAGLGYNHFGDLVAYNFDNKYYLLVPIENGTPGYAIAVFRAEDLACLGFDILRINYNNPPLLNNAAGWCATDNGGNVYTSRIIGASLNGTEKLSSSNTV